MIERSQEPSGEAKLLTGAARLIRKGNAPGLSQRRLREIVANAGKDPRLADDISEIEKYLGGSRKLSFRSVSSILQVMNPIPVGQVSTDAPFAVYSLKFFSRINIPAIITNLIPTLLLLWQLRPYVPARWMVPWTIIVGSFTFFRIRHGLRLLRRPTAEIDAKLETRRICWIAGAQGVLWSGLIGIAAINAPDGIPHEAIAVVIGIMGGTLGSFYVIRPAHAAYLITTVPAVVLSLYRYGEAMSAIGIFYAAWLMTASLRLWSIFRAQYDDNRELGRQVEELRIALQRDSDEPSETWRTDKEHRILRPTKALANRFDATAAEIAGEDILELLSKQGADDALYATASQKALYLTMMARKPINLQIVPAVLEAEIAWFSISGTPTIGPGGEFTGYTGTIRRVPQKQIGTVQGATIDGRTQLPIYSGLSWFIQGAALAASVGLNTTALILIRTNRFRGAVNPDGTEIDLLELIARRLRPASRQTVTVDENDIAILWTGWTHVDEVKAEIDRLKTELALPYIVAGRSFRADLSVTAALAPVPNSSPRALIERAREASQALNRFSAVDRPINNTDAELRIVGPQLTSGQREGVSLSLTHSSFDLRPEHFLVEAPTQDHVRRLLDIDDLEQVAQAAGFRRTSKFLCPLDRTLLAKRDVGSLLQAIILAKGCNPAQLCILVQSADIHADGDLMPTLRRLKMTGLHVGCDVRGSADNEDLASLGFDTIILSVEQWRGLHQAEREHMFKSSSIVLDLDGERLDGVMIPPHHNLTLTGCASSSNLPALDAIQLQTALLIFDDAQSAAQHSTLSTL